MPYIDGKGSIVQSRSNFRLSLLSDIFWGIFDVVGIFFQSLFSPGKKIVRGDRKAVNNSSGKPVIRQIGRPAQGTGSCAPGGG